MLTVTVIGLLVALGADPVHHWNRTAAVLVVLIVLALGGYLWLAWLYRRRG